MADSNQLPSMLIESLKEEKEDRARIENIEKINVSLKDKQIKLSEEQTDQLIALRNSLESDSLQTLEDKKEANSVASDTLGLLSDIKDNTEDLKFDFGSGKEGIVQKVIVFGQLLLTSFTAGFIKGVTSIFQFPTLKKIFNKLVIRPLKATIFKPVIKLFNYISSVFRALGDIYKKAGKGQFLKASTFKIFGNRSIKFLTALFKGIKQGVTVVKSFGNVILKGFMFIKGGILKIMKPFKNIGTAFKDILNQIKSLSGGKGPLSGIMNSIRTIGGLLGKFKGLFSLLGFAIGKLLFPVLAVIDFIRGIVDSLNTTEFTSPVAKAIDALLTGVGFAVGGFIGGLLDLLKAGFSFITEKLGFEGLSEWLDSFSIREMIEKGFSDIAEFFETLVDPQFLGALMAGVKAAINPADGKSFNDGFNEYAVYGKGGKPESTVIRREGEVTPEEMSRYADQTEGMSAAETIAFIEAQREVESTSDFSRRSKRKKGYIIPFSNVSGAEMEATQNDIADAKATPVVAPTGVVANMQNIDNSSSSVVKTTNMNNHIDRTSMAAFAPAY